MRRRAAPWLAAAIALAIVAPPAVARPDNSGIVASGPPFQLSVAQLLAWRRDGATADARNVSRVPLAPRFVDRGPGVDPAARPDPQARVMYAPDGMNNLGNYLVPQHRFNLYGFTHWAQIDILNWFAGTASETVAIPARPWVDAAHRNGVKVIGTVFFAPAAWGGSVDTVAQFLRRDAGGGFPAADRLAQIARHYGFDGWLMNVETDLDAHPALAREMAAFTAYLKRISPQPQEIHWYDAMLPDGKVGWQNAYNTRNAPLLQDGSVRVADGMFLNYDWSVAGLREGAALAERLSRSRYDLFVGADLWPMRDAQPAFRNNRWLRDLRAAGGGASVGSIALFAPNFNYSFGGDARTPRFSRFDRDPSDAQAFLQAEERLFAGDARNMAATSATPGDGWEGIAAMVPPRSTIMSLPFSTSFNIGQGRVLARRGRIVGGPWHDMSRADILPSWQFAYPVGTPLRVEYDFDQPYQGGAALRFTRAAAIRRPVAVPLFLTAIATKGPVRISWAATGGDGQAIRLTLGNGTIRDIRIESDRQWRIGSACVEFAAGDEIRRISLLVGPGLSQPAKNMFRLGFLAVEKGCRASVTIR